MSDIQILTGFSMLIAGYVQLPCGLSAYHWQTLVYLTWFASLTHLSCLTLLRSYLYENPGQRLWRWIAMGVIVIMLVAAIVPTGNFDWVPAEVTRGFQPNPPPSSYAICFYYQKGFELSSSYISMIFSTIFLLGGFLTRVVRIHKCLSIDVALQLRSWWSKFGMKYLRRVYDWSDVQSSPRSLKRLLVYRPLLTVFLVLRICLDVYRLCSLK
jgi:hypothetical protein